MGKIGNTTFKDDCAKGMTFEQWDKTFASRVVKVTEGDKTVEKTINTPFKDDDGQSIDKKKVFKAMGGK